MPYLETTDVETFLNIDLHPGGEALVSALIPALEAYANSYCNRKWGVSSAQVEAFDGGRQVYFPSNSPISSVSSVTIDGTALSASEYFVYGSYVRLDSKAAAGYRNVVITYIANVSLPDDLKHALIRWAAEIFKAAEDAGKTAKRVKFGPSEVEYLVQDGCPKYVEMVLNRYRLSPI